MKALQNLRQELRYSSDDEPVYCRGRRRQWPEMDGWRLKLTLKLVEHKAQVNKLTNGGLNGAHKHLVDLWDAERKARQGEMASAIKVLSK